MTLWNYWITKERCSRAVTGSAGIIAAAAAGMGDGAPLWLVVGTDRQGLEQAVGLLVNDPQQIRDAAVLLWFRGGL